jgi:hypothetical protein
LGAISYLVKTGEPSFIDELKKHITLAIEDWRREVEQDEVFGLLEHQSDMSLLATVKLAQNRLPILRKKIMKAFDLRELDELCFELGINFEIISGTTINEKSLHLVRYLDRRGCINALIIKCREFRPGIEWD